MGGQGVFPVSSIFSRAAFAALALFTAHVAYAQEVSSTVRGTLGAKFRLFADVENVLNLINRNWNTYKVFNDTVSVTNVSCVAQGSNSCARYLYSNPNDQVATTLQNASLWQVRVGARIDFNALWRP